MKLYLLFFLEHKVTQSFAQSYSKINFQFRDTLCFNFVIQKSFILLIIKNIIELRNFNN